MQIVIDITEDDYRKVQDGRASVSIMRKAIRNGTPLDKIKTELHATAEMHEDGDYYLREEWIDEIFDNYKAETEQVGNPDRLERGRRKQMTYGDIEKQFYDKFPNAEVNDWRPADPLFIPELLKPIPNAILVWLKDGSRLVFISGEVGESE